MATRRAGTEDQRVARNPGEPPQGGPVGAARWADYLDWVRAEVVGAVLALSAAEQRRPRVPSGWTPIELLSHVLHMEQRWFVWGFLGEPVDQPWGDWTVPEPWEQEGEGRWQVSPDVTADQLAARLDEIGARTRGVLRDFPLCALSSAEGRFAVDPPSLEWICFHVLAEYARHAGQLDIVVELAAGGDAGAG